MKPLHLRPDSELRDWMLLSPRFRYIPAVHTDVAATFAQEWARLEAEKRESNVRVLTWTNGWQR